MRYTQGEIRDIRGLMTQLVSLIGKDLFNQALMLASTVDSHLSAINQGEMTTNITNTNMDNSHNLIPISHNNQTLHWTGLLYHMPSHIYTDSKTPLPRYKHTIAECGNIMYMFGGTNIGGNKGECIFRNMLSFDTNTLAWEKCSEYLPDTEYPTGLHSHTMTYVSYIYIYIYI